ncbi:phasin family protein [Aurantiacibacter marinus]|nr:phasin family protein [Aurantiacibacter marinus]
MATKTTKTTDFTNVVTDTLTGAVNEMQTRAQSAYEKSTEAMSEMTDFAKGNVEAVVESGKLLVEGVQTMGTTYADEAKTAYETATADIKEMASIKSPTDLFQLQGKIMRRNFDAMIAATTKNTDAAMKLANDAVAPISGRVSVATEKMSKVA